MSTSLKIDDALVAKAMKVGKHGSKNETVSCALEEYISRHQQKKAIKLFGTIDYDNSYDYKAQRKRPDSKRVGGQWKGLVRMSEDFDGPLPFSIGDS